MSHTTLVLGTNWESWEWPDTVGVIHEIDVSLGYAHRHLDYVPERTCKNVDKIDKDAFFCCSECHEVNHDHSYNPWNYCPSCGARVVGD